jgi:hypothetical protein
VTRFYICIKYMVLSPRAHVGRFCVSDPVKFWFWRMGAGREEMEGSGCGCGYWLAMGA